MSSSAIRIDRMPDLLLVIPSLRIGLSCTVSEIIGDTGRKYSIIIVHQHAMRAGPRRCFTKTLSDGPSVRHVVVLDLNECTYRQTFFTFWYHPRFLNHYADTKFRGLPLSGEALNMRGVRKFCDGVYNGFDKMPGSDGQTDGEKSSINIARVITITRDKNIFNSSALNLDEDIA